MKAKFLAAGMLLLMAGCAAQPPPPTIIVKHDLAPPPKPTIPSDPYATLEPQVADAIKQNKTPVFHLGILTEYPYDPNAVIKIRCLDLHVTQIRLQPGERTTMHDVMWGDPQRWAVTVGDGVVMIEPLGLTHTTIEQSGQGIMIRPPDPKMETNLSIHTNRGHWYTLTANEIDHGQYTQAVAWYYPDEVRAQASARALVLKELKQ